MFNKIKKVGSKKVVLYGGIPATVLGVGSTAFASGGGGDVSSSITTALTAVKTDALATISAVAPIGIAIMGVFLVWRYGIRFFKSISK